MARFKIQSLQSLREEMRAVARGQRPAPADAAKPPPVAAKPAATAARKPAPQTQPAQRPAGQTNLAPPARAAGTSEQPGDP